LVSFQQGVNMGIAPARGPHGHDASMMPAWCPSASCRQHGVPRVSPWCQHGVHAASTRRQRGVNAVSTWCPHGVNMLEARCQHGVRLVLSCCRPWRRPWCRPYGADLSCHGSLMDGSLMASTMVATGHTWCQPWVKYGVDIDVVTTSSWCQHQWGVNMAPRQSASVKVRTCSQDPLTPKTSVKDLRIFWNCWSRVS
jgi:hypothetical protein